MKESNPVVGNKERLFKRYCNSVFSTPFLYPSSHLVEIKACVIVMGL